MRKSCSFILALLVAVALWGCSEKPETAVVPIETVALQHTESPIQTETDAPTMLATQETTATEPEEKAPSATAAATEPVTVKYSVVDEYVYATTDVNIRSGPGTEYEVIDYLPKGDEINRIGIGSDGWSQVNYKGDGAYIRSKYLTTEEQEAKPAPVVSNKVTHRAERPAAPEGGSFDYTEDTEESVPVVAPQPPAEVPTEAPPYVEPERIDVSALTAHGNNFAESLGFSVDYSVRDGYFPPDTVGFSSMNAARSNVEGNVMVLYNNIIARDGSIDGYRCCVTVSDNGNGTYTTTVYYG